MKSRILYEQMLGRATRLCPDLFGPGEDKDVFHIYDAVDLYATLSDFTDMKPVVTDAALTLRQLVDALLSSTATVASKHYFHHAVVARLRRKRALLRQHSEVLSRRPRSRCPHPSPARGWNRSQHRSLFLQSGTGRLDRRTAQTGIEGGHSHFSSP